MASTLFRQVIGIPQVEREGRKSYVHNGRAVNWIVGGLRS